MTLPGDDDLDFVRRQLDDLGLARSMGMTGPHDEVRYQELCRQEAMLLRLVETATLVETAKMVADRN